MRLVVAVFCVASSGLFSNPINPTVVEGDVSFTTSSSVLTVASNSYRSIIDWEEFSIDPGETTFFDLINTNAALLNRVTTENLSEIYGSLESNGQIYLINPYGIYIHEGAVVSAASFLASTLDVDNEEFLLGDEITFVGDGNGVVSNFGQIEAAYGDVALFGFQVVQGGTVQVDEGDAFLATGMEIILYPNNNPRVSIVAGSTDATGTGVEILKQVSSIHTEVKAEGNYYQYAIHLDQDGNIETNGYGDAYACLESHDGKIQVEGKISSHNNADLYGGLIEIIGREVDITDSAVLDVSGVLDCGEIYITEG